MKKILTFLLAFTLFTPAADAFKDTESQALDRLIEKGVLTDGDFFLPEIRCSREQFTTWALKNVGEDVTGERIREPFADIVPTQDFAPFVARAWELGVIETTGMFNPKDAITKLDALSILLELEGFALPRNNLKLNFIDVPRSGDARGVVAKALELRLVDPITNEVFGSNVKLNRMECAKLIDAVSLNRRAEEVLFDRPQNNQETGTFDRVIETIESKYLNAEDVDINAMEEQMIRELVNSLGDENTVYFNEQEVADFLLNIGVGTQYGIGAQVGVDDQGRVQIIMPLLDSPAEQAGLEPGDVFLEVNGIDVSSGDMLLEEVVTFIKGENGSEVELLMLRRNTEFEVTIVRGPIENQSMVASEYNDYLLIEMFFFGSDTADKFEEAIAEFPRAAKRGIIIDLRNNPGGFLDTAVEILGILLPENTVAVKTRGVDLLSTTRVKGPSTATENPLVIIVNERSASSSEILAGGVQDNDRGAVIGTQTFGKGTAQELIQFPNGSALKVTVAEWLTPSDRNINEVGIEPDFILSDEATNSNDDSIYDYAIRLIERGQWR